MNTAVIDRSERAVVTTEQVAKVVAGTSLIGLARHALETAGFTATVTANRVTIDHEIIADFVAVNGRTWWQVYPVDGTPRVWIVGAEADDPGNWAGAE